MATSLSPKWKEPKLCLFLWNAFFMNKAKQKTDPSNKAGQGTRAWKGAQIRPTKLITIEIMSVSRDIEKYSFHPSQPGHHRLSTGRAPTEREHATSCSSSSALWQYYSFLPKQTNPSGFAVDKGFLGPVLGARVLCFSFFVSFPVLVFCFVCFVLI